jgi:hypothetical protein
VAAPSALPTDPNWQPARIEGGPSVTEGRNADYIAAFAEHRRASKAAAAHKVYLCLLGGIAKRICSDLE